VIIEFSRRKFLLAAGGTTLALPVLEALTTREALAAYEQVRRVLFFLTSNGTPVEGRPTGTGAGYSLGKVHAGLQKYKEKMLYVAGLDGKAASISNGDPHACGFATSLSGRKALPGTLFKHGACFMDANCASTGWGDGPSLDYELGQQLLAAKAPVVYGMLNFSVKNLPASLYTRSSYSAPGEPITPYADPQVTFDTIFKMPTMSSMMDAASAARVKLRRSSVLDELQSEISSLQLKVSASDKARLDKHLTAIRELEATIQAANDHPTSTACKPPERPTLKAGAAVQRNAGGMETNVNEDKTDNLQERHKVWHQMIIAAFGCDLTRVITLMNQPSRSDTFMPWLASDASYPGTFTNPHHAASHANDVPTLIAMDHWYATQISDLADSMASTLDSEGKPLLDRSAIAWFNELSNGPNHTHEDKTHTIVGNLGGFFKTNQAVQYPKGTPANVLLTAIAQGMGMQTDHYGGSDSALMGGDVSLVKA
jgi:hypothetical protein